MAKKSAKVEEIRTLMRGLPEDMIENIGIEPLKKPCGQFETLEDLRYQPFVEHRLPEIGVPEAALVGALALLFVFDYY
jgi:hypothetical protein